MSDCCSNNKPKTSETCPQCGIDCKSVEMRTLYHQLVFPNNTMLTQHHYYFCSSQQCSTAYFSTTGTLIPTIHLRTYHEIQNSKLCYCFDIDANTYLSALSTQRADAIKDFIIEHTKSGDCACQLRNPSGQCCLANFKHLELEYKNNQ